MDAVFSNGTEYMMFDEEFCCNCKKYVPYEKATDDNPVCPIEDAIAQAMFEIELFPHKFIKRDSVTGPTYCTEFERED